MQTHKLFKVLVLGGAVLGSGCGAGNPSANSTGTTGGAATTTGGATGGGTTASTHFPDGGGSSTTTTATTGHGSGVTGW